MNFKTVGARMNPANERPKDCSKGCTGRMCRDALHCDGKRESTKQPVRYADEMPERDFYEGDSPDY